MKRYSMTELQDTLVTYGRTFLEPKEDILFFNWTCSTVEFTFHGTHLNASFRADCSEEIEGAPWDPNAPKRKTWPWVAVFLDDMPMPIRKFEVSSPNETWLLYQSLVPQTHKIRLTKLTENNKTFLGLTAFTAEGEFLPTEKKEAKKIEFVGDSITCGYGNISKERDRGFYSIEEDGWMAYGPRTARNLGLQWSCVSVSGITAVKHPGWPGDFAMNELYRYTDRVYQTKLGIIPLEWDFRNHPSDIVVVNLGTNDNFALLFSGDPAEEEKFGKEYISFIKEIRALNGPDTQIVCALGSMSYYLFHDIDNAVADYKKESGDEKICTFRFKPMHPMDGFGAAGHPSMATHEKMSAELTEFLKQYL